MSLRTIDPKPLENFLSKMDTTKMTCMQVVNKVYEYTYLTYKTEWLASEAEVDRMTALVVKKNIEIDLMRGQIATLVTLCEGANIEVPKQYQSIREQISAQVKEETR